MRSIRMRLLAVAGVTGCALALTVGSAGAQELPELPLPTPIPVPPPEAPALPVPPPPPVPDGPLAEVSPDVQVGVCGNGVAVGGTGTTSDCADEQSAGSESSDAAVGVSPTAEVGVCGNGVAVGGTGTTSDCGDQQSASAAGDGGIVGLDPTVQAAACGNGVALFGVGTTAVCGAQQAADASGSGSGNGAVGDLGDGLGDAIGDPNRVAGDGNGLTLPLTGIEPVLMALAGLALTSVGGVARLRVMGS